METTCLQKFDGQSKTNFGLIGPILDESKTNFNILLDDRKFVPAWNNIIVLSYVHLGAIYGIYLAFTSAHIFTIVLLFFCHVVGTMGVTAGLHRLWAHKAYKAKLPLRIILMICVTLSYQGTIIHWVRDHRTHHKYSDTPADPHNISYGFLYAHCGWLIRKKSPLVRMKGSQIDMSDLYADPVVMFQYKYKFVLAILVAMVLPTAVAMYFWKESFSNAFFVNTLRYAITLHVTCLVNSLAHYIGGRPYNVKIQPRENTLVSSFTFGEGFHNYHHTFPWDYKAAELGNYSLNPTTAVLDLCAKIGWAYDLRTPTKEIIRNRCSKTGFNHETTW